MTEGIALDLAAAQADPDGFAALAERAGGTVFLHESDDGGLDPWTTAVWLAGRTQGVRIGLPGTVSAASAQMREKSYESLEILAGPRLAAAIQRRDGIDYDGIPASLADGAVAPGDPRYRGRKSTYMRGGSPGLVLRPRTVAEVADALAFASRHQHLPLGLRSGGHGISGRSTNDGGLVIDVGLMNDVQVLDEPRRLVRVGPGATWKQVAAVLDKYDWAIGSGDYGGVGVGGLATAGGIGFMSREHGLTIDQLRAVELVLADGTAVRASADENQELFWAVRGAGANFGVATAFEFEAAPVHEVGWAQLALVSPDLEQTLVQFGEVARTAPRDTTVFFLTGPPRQGQSVVQLYGMVDSGDPDTVVERLTPFASTGLLAQQQVVITRYADVMGQAADVGPGGHHGQGEPVARSAFLPRLTPEFARDVVELLASGQVFFFQLRHMGGAIADTPSDATAFAHRTPEFSVTAMGSSGAVDEAWDRLAHHFDGLYLSFDTRTDRQTDAFPPATLARLRTLKRELDPGNLFRDNFNIDPEVQK
ncbi:FAD-binding oxidoreductase [Actinoplanes sp. TRM 88003]|uniref:FAD-binding oxidoreductase n=1 Tax=Paractinoplanes aksuensis TaxID=2939490 RepID=A0ABT1DX28_9ACTN|nr:FAD-binding oxidoreductase [Actinoplanes aksuensis]MCO8274181.1 FAD-binding oxidoreductase [Actinoplanes aksuensis]